LRDRNSLLLAAGYAPRYQETSIDDPSMAHVRASLQRVLGAHDPYPGVVLDRRWNIVLANESAARLVGAMSPHLLTPTINIFRISLHPEGLAAITLNLGEWAGYLLAQLRRLVVMSGDDDFAALEREVLAYPNIDALMHTGAIETADDTPLLVPCRLELDGAELSLFTTLTTFGTPRDITLDELAIELFFPADEATGAVLRARA
ncbi:MAG: transcriptional regulator, partial [Ilumatobacteraceae bacterium]